MEVLSFVVKGVALAVVFAGMSVGVTLFVATLFGYKKVEVK